MLDDAAAAAEETWRILVRPAAAATVVPAPRPSSCPVMAEVLDHLTAAYPDAGIDVASYVVAHTGLTVEVSVNGAGRYAPEGLGTLRAAGAAQAHVRRSRSGLSISLPSGAPPAGGTGVVASIAAPASAVTIDEPAWSSMATAAVAPFGGNGNGWKAAHVGNGYTAVPGRNAPAPEYAPSSSSHVDELFGPMLDLPYQPTEDRRRHPDLRGDRLGLVPEGPTRNADPEPRRGSDPIDWESAVGHRVAGGRGPGRAAGSAAVHRFRVAAPPAPATSWCRRRAAAPPRSTSPPSGSRTGSATG